MDKPKTWLPGAFIYSVGTGQWRYSPCKNCGAKQCFLFLGDNKLYSTDTTVAYAVPHVCNLGDQLL